MEQSAEELLSNLGAVYFIESGSYSAASADPRQEHLHTKFHQNLTTAAE